MTTEPVTDKSTATSSAEHDAELRGSESENLHPRLGTADIDDIDGDHIFVAAPRKWFSTPAGRSFLHELLKEEGGSTPPPLPQDSVTKNVVELASLICAAVIIGFGLYKGQQGGLPQPDSLKP